MIKKTLTKTNVNLSGEIGYEINTQEKQLLFQRLETNDKNRK